MTRDIAAPYPPGKRIQIQADKLTLLTNMWRSTWLSVETLTTVGYGHMKPRTPLGRLVDILTMVFGWCYTAIPLSLVGGQFYTCYDQYLRKSKMNKEYDDDDDDDDDALDWSAPKDTVPLAVLSDEDSDLLKNCSTLTLLVDEMMRNMYKINLLSPTPAALAVSPEDAGIPIEEIRANSVSRMQGNNAMADVSFFVVRRGSNVSHTAHTVGPGRKGSLVATRNDRLTRFKILRQLILSEANQLMNIVLQLTRVLEKVVAPSSTVELAAEPADDSTRQQLC
ncbi:Aste57867_4040 [Aphanomyces stellatus]|uniref:Aste57867_4040 protein n=1 Tax=Aphanomyces stellatus TaxID=120398 RepID=A0A485KF96_9STRA|nr:hypothetical protein As57867_004029 [Aphanomyces stellatus]VFT81175.1 Aste57867_4040 [Aphanomyces stellatus]